MLLNGVHLLPDVSGAMVWPSRQLLAVSDPVGLAEGRDALALAAFGPSARGTEVMTPAFLSTFRRPFQALMLVHGKVVTRPRARLEPPS